MKKVILLFLSFGLFFGLNAQITVDISPAMTVGTADIDDATTNPEDVIAHATITNNSTEDKTFKWNLIIGDHPAPWTVAVCDVDVCYNPGVVTAQFDLAAGASGSMDVHVYPSGNSSTLEGAVPGVGNFAVKVSEVGDDDNNFTGEYVFTVTGNPFTALNELEIAQLSLFPNPATDFFQLEGPKGVEKITMYNLLGQEIAQFNVNDSKTYDISQLPRGMFLVALIDEEDQLLKTVRLQRR